MPGENCLPGRPAKTVKLTQLVRLAVSLATAASVLASPVWAAVAPADADGRMPDPAAANAAPDRGITDQIIVKYRPSVAAKGPQTARWSALAGVALTHARAFGEDGHVLKLGKSVSLAQAQALAKKVAADPDVEYAEADQMMQPTLTPNDSYYANQWGYFAPVAGQMGANLPAAWDIVTGSASIYIAVIDTGIRPHADLVGRYVGGYDFINTLSVANDGNLRDSDASDPGGWVAAGECGTGSAARNSSWHGTHVAGTIAAASNNGSGVTGINWVSKVVPVRVLGKCGGYTSDIADGMRWAAGLNVAGVPANPYPVKVMNLSLGGGGSCGTTYQNAINAVTAAGAVVVVAAGNSGADASTSSPGNCNGVITVAATGKAGNRASYSNYGSLVEIAAPGGDSSGGILSTLNTGATTPVSDTYAYYQGTSMATPHVAGIVSLMFSVNPNLTPAQVTQILQSTATAFPAGSTCATSTCGAGIVNAAAALRAAGNTALPPPGAFGKLSPSNGATKRQTPLTLSWAASSGAASYDYCVDTTNDNACLGGWVNVGAATSVTVSGLSSRTTYYWQVRATNASGQTLANGGTWWRFTTR